jgi:hypothetical protein
MKRASGALALVAALGCASTGAAGVFMSHVWGSKSGCADGACNAGCNLQTPAMIPGMMGPWGAPVPYAAPYNATPVTGESAARAMLAQSVPLDLLQQAYNKNGKMAPEILQVQAGGPMMLPAPGGISPPGMAPQPLPPGVRIPGAVAAVGALTGGGAAPFPVQRTEVRFVGPNGMKISWYAPTADGKAGFGAQALEAPGRYNFLQGAVYRLKLSDIPGRPGVDLYPTLEVAPANAKTATFLAHSAVPVNFTNEDLEQVAAGNFIVKVIYLPDPQFQDLAVTGADEIVSSRLEPGVDPLAEAHRRGTVLLVVRLGNIDLELANSPAMDAPNPYHKMMPHAMGPQGGMMPGMAGGPQMPLPPGMMLPPGQMLPPAQGLQLTPGMSAPQMPVMPPAAPVMPGAPVGKAKTDSAVQTVGYKAPAALAGQSASYPPYIDTKK